MIKRYVVPSLVAVTAVFPAWIAFAADHPKVMDDVVVTASRIAESKKEVSANVTVITNKEIRQSAARDVGDLLAEKNIGHIQKYPGNLTSIGIRGFRTDTHGNDLQGKVLVLLDGRRAGSGNVDKFLTKNVERIEIIRGPGAVQYGSAGMGGVVNIITKRGSTNAMFVEAGGGAFDTYEGSIGGEAAEGAFDFAGAFTYGSSDDYETGDGDTFYNTGVEYETGLSANLGYSFRENQRLGIIFTLFDVGDSGSPNYISAIDRDDTSDKSNYSFDFSYTGEASGYQWLARAFFGEDKNTWKDPVASNPDFWDDGVDSFNETDQLGVQLQASKTFGTTTITSGFDGLSYDVDNSYTPEETEYDNLAFFALGKSRFLEDKLTINYGFRYDWYEVKVSQPAGRDEDQDRLTPLIGVAYQIFESTKIRAQYAQGFVMPSAQQLAADYSGSFGRTVGNPNLDPEKNQTYEAGLDLNYQGLTGSLTYFYTDFEDKIVSSYLPGGISTWDNIGDATISGFEAEISYDIGDLFGWQWEVKPYLGATLLTNYEDESTDEDLLYISGTTLSTGLVVDNGAGMFARLNLAHTGSQDVQDWESGSYPAPVIELDSFTVVNLTGAYRFYENPDFGALTVRCELTNLFDEDYAFVKGYPMPGRGFFVSLRWEY